MKEMCFLLLFSMVMFSAPAQRRVRAGQTELRDLIVVVRDTLGRPLDHVSVSAFSRSDGRAANLRKDRSGNHFYRVAETDTLDLFVMDGYLEFPVAGMDTLLLTVSGLTDAESVHYIDPVTVTGQRDVMIDTGFGMISATRYSGPGGLLDMRRAKFHHNLISFLENQGSSRGLYFRDGQVYIRGSHQSRLMGGVPIPPLFVVDGVPGAGGLRDLSDIYPMDQIESILVMRFSPMYGPRGYGGVILITTKKDKDN